jgi:dTDP-4-amino-4,6-dideoxygalactose transaminase
MEGYIKPIGGEHWLTLKLFNNENDNFKNTKATFLSGGQSAIRFIIENINFKNSDVILMPSYLCSTILYSLIEKGINYEFYGIKKDLSIDLDNLEAKIKKFSPKAIFVIDYFGFYHNNETITFINSCKSKGIRIIEDAVQMLWFNKRKFSGDYVFNSYRKFLPIDGSIVLCDNIGNYEWFRDDYYKLVNKARMDKTLYNRYNIGEEKDFLDLFRQAEEEYYKRNKIMALDKNSFYMLSKINKEYIFKKRIENYVYLYEKLSRIFDTQILNSIEKITDNVPLGLPILIKNRNSIRKYLASKNIFCPVHWNINEIDFKGNKFNDSMYLSDNILTIPIDHRYDFEDLDRVIENISYALTNNII